MFYLNILTFSPSICGSFYKKITLMINLELLAKAIYEKNFEEFSKFFQKDAVILGYTVEGYFNFITRHLGFDLYKNVIIFTNLLLVKKHQYVMQIFFNEILILEENICLDPETNLINGTNYSTDCFGKLIIFNDKIDRLLTIRPKRGVEIKDIFFLEEDLEESLHISRGNMFNDGYFTGYFKLNNDSFETKITKLKIVTDKGIESQYVVLRGIDYPFFQINKPNINGKRIIFTENIRKIYRVLITFEDNSEIELTQDDLKEQIMEFDKNIKKVYQSINGCAMNYFIDS
jgi:hypothetical protein